ncbi:MAG: BrnA antitoxin family protein [Gammaproteobacteria bacterium]|nr:BrnA antitoxin family protein [Gammaproteobacteria bacterium]
MKSVNIEKPFPSTDAEWEALIAEAPAAAIDSDASYDPNDPAAVEAFWANAVVVREGGPAAVRAALAERRCARGSQKAPLKVPTTIRFDADVLVALKATGKGWQTRVNAVMRQWIQDHSHPANP